MSSTRKKPEKRTVPPSSKPSSSSVPGMEGLESVIGADLMASLQQLSKTSEKADVKKKADQVMADLDKALQLPDLLDRKKPQDSRFVHGSKVNVTIPVAIQQNRKTLGILTNYYIASQKTSNFFAQQSIEELMYCVSGSLAQQNHAYNMLSKKFKPSQMPTFPHFVTRAAYLAPSPKLMDFIEEHKDTLSLTLNFSEITSTCKKGDHLELYIDINSSDKSLKLSNPRLVSQDIGTFKVDSDGKLELPKDYSVTISLPKNKIINPFQICSVQSEIVFSAKRKKGVFGKFQEYASASMELNGLTRSKISNEFHLESLPGKHQLKASGIIKVDGVLAPRRPNRHDIQKLSVVYFTLERGVSLPTKADWRAPNCAVKAQSTPNSSSQASTPNPSGKKSSPQSVINEEEREFQALMKSSSTQAAAQDTTKKTVEVPKPVQLTAAQHKKVVESGIEPIGIEWGKINSYDVIEDRETKIMNGLKTMCEKHPALKDHCIADMEGIPVDGVPQAIVNQYSKMLSVLETVKERKAEIEKFQDDDRFVFADYCASLLLDNFMMAKNRDFNANNGFKPQAMLMDQVIKKTKEELAIYYSDPDEYGVFQFPLEHMAKTRLMKMGLIKEGEKIVFP
ncbi:hypothetical protein ADUPG1_004679 [Aduncisulcus paluster]|uniref:Uncharacterized protein n=1 Tax=Aduncisulcus paluster TaxID=2918883 RepID=A0ABQ5K290_9EUKA|nr:hypothetical protein ADUPG1_004679 [Aduncisulcus paluster]